MQQGLGNRCVAAVNPIQHSCCDSQRVQARFGIKILAGAFQPLANLSDNILRNCFPQLLFLSLAKFDEKVHQVRFPPRLAR